MCQPGNPSPHGLGHRMGDEPALGGAGKAEALAERDDWDLTSTAALQMCTLSLPWRDLRESVLAATRAAQKADADLLISFGGGSPNDTAKLVALCLAENITSTEQLDRYRIRFQYPDQLEVPIPENPCLPHISITTTLSSSSSYSYKTSKK